MADINKNNLQTDMPPVSVPKKRQQRKEPRPPRKITERYLHNAGLHYLQRFAASSGHFRNVMMRKVDKSCAHHKEQDRAACEKMLDELIIKFKEIGLIDDFAYARGMVNSLRRKGLSSKAIHMKMRLKCLPSEVIQEALESYNEENNITTPELTAALRLCQRKRMGPFDRNSSAALNVVKDIDEDEVNGDREQFNKKKQRQLSALARAGFAYDIAKKALEMSPEDAEEHGFL